MRQSQFGELQDIQIISAKEVCSRFLFIIYFIISEFHERFKKDSSML